VLLLEDRYGGWDRIMATDTILFDFRKIEDMLPLINQDKAVRVLTDIAITGLEGRLKRRIEKRIAKYAVPSQVINHRQLFAMPQNPDVPNRDIGERSRLAHKITIEALNKGYERRNAPDCLVYSTNTCFTAPSPVRDFFSRRDWTHINNYEELFHGCFAALPAMRVGSNHAKSEGGRADIFNIELSSPYIYLPNDPGRGNIRPDEIISATLFSDGAILYSVCPENEFFNSTYGEKKGLRILGFKEALVPDTPDFLTLSLNKNGIDVYLSDEIPSSFKGRVKPFVSSLLDEVGVDQEERLHWALHPGGSKILESVIGDCGLDKGIARNSYDLLRNRGNMTSVCIPYLLADICEDKNIPYGSKVVALTFGPGLTVYGAVFEKVGVKK
jgi:predicted naringenin-chalcone synthase